MAVYAYIRVSTEQQNEARQREAISNYCAQNNIKDYKVYMDKLSGGTMNRPELQRLLQVITSGDTIIVKDVSRLARSLSNFIEMFEDFKARDIRFVSINEGFDSKQSGIMGEAMLKMMAIIAEMERSIINERVREGVAIAKRNGKCNGRPATKHDDTLIKMVCDQFIANKITGKKAAELLDNVSIPTFYRILHKYEITLNEKAQ